MPTYNKTKTSDNLMLKMSKFNNNQLSHFGLIKEIMC